MNQKLFEKRKESLRLLSSSYNLTKNVIKFGKGETTNHFLAKCLLCKEAKDLEKEFITEAIFHNKKRADIFILDDSEAWEVLESESKERFEAKKQEYPCKIIGFNAKEVIRMNLTEVQSTTENR